MVGARSANQKIGWSAERRFMIVSRSVERCFEANMGGARSAKSKFPGALFYISQFSNILNVRTIFQVIPLFYPRVYVYTHHVHIPHVHMPVIIRSLFLSMFIVTFLARH